MTARDGLERFVEAQAGSYSQALAELTAGAKRGHWMWFVFPQIAGLGHSPTAQFYAIEDRAEAQAYCRHPVLGPRLRDCTRAVLGWAGRRTAADILGNLDAMKFKSSMTLFEASCDDPRIFAEALETLCNGVRCAATLRRLDG